MNSVPSAPLVALEGLGFRHPGGPPLLERLDARLEAGSCVALLGPNGSGKSTLLQLIGGLLAPGAGRVLVEGRDLARADRRWTAGRIAFVPQEHHPGFGFTVREMIRMGRAPHAGPFGFARPADEAAVEAAARRLDLTPLLPRVYTRLSGGERKRVILARALAQETPVLLLDEPDAHLDIRHQHDFLARARDLASAEGKLVVFSVHLPELAARYADRALLLPGRGQAAEQGPAGELLAPERLAAVYGIPFVRVRAGDATLPLADPGSASARGGVSLGVA